MKPLFISVILCLLFTPFVAMGQAVGQWTTHLAYNNATQVEETASYVYVMADNSLYRYGKEDNSLTFLSKQTGLSDTKIATIAYNHSVGSLIVVYSTGNIDLISEEGASNLPALMNAANIQSKTVNSISFDKHLAYLSGEFGIMVLDLKRQEVKEAYLIGHVLSSCVLNNNIYAVTDQGVIRGDQSKNLIDSNEWERYQTGLEKDSDIREIYSFDHTLVYRMKGGSTNGLRYEVKPHVVEVLNGDANIFKLKATPSGLIALSSKKAYIYSSLTSFDSPAFAFTLNDLSSLKGQNNYWAAAGTDGLIGLKRSSATKYDVTVAELKIDGPKRNLAWFMRFQGEKLLVAGGSRWDNTGGRPATFMVYDNNEWWSFNERLASQQVTDYLSAIQNPKDHTHYFVASYYGGLIEIKDGKFIERYTNQNSVLETSDNKNQSQYYVRIDGLAYDKNNNLWMTNSGVKNGIKILKEDGTWVSYPYLSDRKTVGSILITQRGHKWVVVPRPSDDKGIFVLDDKGTLDDRSDDEHQFYSSFNMPGGGVVAPNAYYCAVEDKNGAVWLGTDLGPVICPSPDRAAADPDRMYATRIIREDEIGENYYYLDGVVVRGIAVDGGNRKWIATEGQGVLLLSEDGMKTIEHFMVDNSPLLSNTVESIAINQVTGEVFMGTDLGIVSYRSDAIKGSESFSDVYAYPNPVRVAVEDKVVITGLMENSLVKITTVDGHLIYQGKSVGGQMTWNCRNAGGSLVKSGVYLVVASAKEGGESVVSKIVIIN